MSDLLTANRFDAAATLETIAADWRRRGYSCQVFVDPPGQRWEDFVHSCNEVVTVLEGRLEMEVSGEIVDMQPGDEVFIPRGAIHSVRNRHSGTSRWAFGYD
ncbi:MAG: cupin domain-containing protein [Rhodospirillales bacterium]|nr:cupin domain-containing protein [Rhodospirillales bacterium]